MAEPIEIIIRKGSGGEGTGFGISGANVKDTEKSANEKTPNVGKMIKGAAVGLAIATDRKSVV